IKEAQKASQTGEASEAEQGEACKAREAAEARREEAGKASKAHRKEASQEGKESGLLKAGQQDRREGGQGSRIAAAGHAAAYGGAEHARWSPGRVGQSTASNSSLHQPPGARAGRSRPGVVARHPGQSAEEWL